MASPETPTIEQAEPMSEEAQREAKIALWAKAIIKESWALSPIGQEILKDPDAREVLATATYKNLAHIFRKQYEREHPTTPEQQIEHLTAA